jgi:hypothetical protein
LDTRTRAHEFKVHIPDELITGKRLDIVLAGDSSQGATHWWRGPPPWMTDEEHTATEEQKTQRTDSTGKT